METTRQQKIARQIQRDIADIFQKEAAHIVRGSMVTVTTVRVSPDFGYAKIYVSVFPFDKGDAILAELKNPEHASPDCMKAGYVDNALMLLDDARELNFTFAYDNHIMNMEFSSVEERKRAFAAVSADDISSLARKIFVPENLTVTVKGNKKKINAEKIRGIALKELL